MPTAEVFTTAELHVPVIGELFVELKLKTGAATFKHNGPMPVNVGTTGALTVILKVVVLAH
jgi:hypothetical protein